MAKTRAWRSFGRAMVFLSTFEARSRLKHQKLSPILVNSSVFFHAVTHETAWISTGPSKWGNVEFDSGYAARIPIHTEDSDQKVFPHIKNIPGIAHLARLNLLTLVTSAELAAEQFRQPIGRFQGYGYDDLNLLAGIRMESVDGHHYDLKNSRHKQLERIAACTDPLYRELLELLGQKNSLDAYHIFTAERHGCHCFLHLDFKLDDAINRSGNHSLWRQLRTKVLLPSALGAELKLVPLSPRLLSYEEVTFFTRPDLCVPGERRRKPPRSDGDTSR